MALLPDAGTAGLYALAVFLVTLGVLVVFVETVRRERLLFILIVSAVLAAALAYIGEFGVSLLIVGFAGAFLANVVFEWLTTR